MLEHLPYCHLASCHQNLRLSPELMNLFDLVVISIDHCVIAYDLPFTDLGHCYHTFVS